jgi:putative DNA primase/helicase
MNIAPVNLSGIPSSLQALPRWVLWKLEERTDNDGNKKNTKVLYNVRTRFKASSTNPKTWATFAATATAYQAGGWDGLGFVFNGDREAGIDLDKCRNPETGEIEPWAQAIIQSADSYTEASVSGTGVHIILEGKLPPKGRRFGPIEMYEVGRFFTISGNRIADTPAEVNDRADILASLHTEIAINYELEKLLKKNTKSDALWKGDQAGYESQSQADLALCSYLTRVTRDEAQIDRLFRRSGLYRDKWERQDYRDWTIDKALTSDRSPKANTTSSTSQAPAHLDAQAFLTEAPPTDAGNAECLELLYRDELRYCHDRKKWLRWDGNRWVIDGAGRAELAALDVVRARRTAAAQIEDPDKARKAFMWALGSESEGKRSAMLNTARILPSFATRVDLYDREPLLAGVPNGVLDLEHGQHRDARREDYITAQLGASYDTGATCPRWDQFLSEIFDGDAELIAFIQRAVGYSLTGDTREHKLFLCFGHGANGKSVFLDVLSRLLGEYAANSSFDTFDAGRRNEATNDLAALKGKRLVTVIETEDDRRLAEARVKQVTGQDKVTCRFLYGEYFDYRPQFKIWMAMNHKPVISGTDNGIWRRIQLIPFTRSFLEREDKTLGLKLHGELSGILNWAMAGLQAWLNDGLGRATAIEAATREYRRESDLVSQWLEECTERDIDSRITASAAIESYAAWCKRNGYRTPTARGLGRRLVELSIEIGKGSGGQRYYFGLALLGTDGPDSGVSGVISSISGKSSLSLSHVDFPPKQHNNATNATIFEKKAKSLPRSDMLLIVNRRLALAEQGDAGALTVARTYMAANDAYDWTEQLDKAEQLSCVEAV